MRALTMSAKGIRTFSMKIVKVDRPLKVLNEMITAFAVGDAVVHVPTIPSAKLNSIRPNPKTLLLVSQRSRGEHIREQCRSDDVPLVL